MLGMGVAVLVFIFAGLFLIDIGINSKFFIRKDFETAFDYLLTGDCASFNNYLYSGGDENWCKGLHEFNSDIQIKSFEIQNLTHKFGNNQAFLNVQLTFISEGKNKIYMINRQMKKTWLKWKIVQEKKPTLKKNLTETQIEENTPSQRILDKLIFPSK